MAGWYDIEISLYSTEGETTQITEKVGVGDIFVTAGQSNSANYGAIKQTPTDERVLAWTNSRWVFANDPQPMAGGAQGSPWPLVGDLLSSEYGVPIGFISLGYPGAPVALWAQYYYYNRIVTEINSVGSKVKAILWHQGEANASTDTIDYTTTLQYIISKTRSGVGYDIPWIIALASYAPWNGTISNVIAAQLQVIDRDPLNFLGPSTDNMINRYRAGIHFSGKGLQEHARRWFNRIKATNLMATAAQP